MAARAEATTLRDRLEAQEAGAARVQAELHQSRRRLKTVMMESVRVQGEAGVAKQAATEMAEELAAATRWRNNAAALVAEELSKAQPAVAAPAAAFVPVGADGSRTRGLDGRMLDAGLSSDTDLGGEDGVVVEEQLRRRVEAAVWREAEVSLRRHMGLVYSRCPRHQAVFDGYQSPFLPPRLVKYRCGCPATVHRMKGPPAGSEAAGEAAGGAGRAGSGEAGNGNDSDGGGSSSESDGGQDSSSSSQLDSLGTVDDIFKRRTVREMVAAERRRRAGRPAPQLAGAEQRGWWCTCGRAEDHGWEDDVEQEDLLARVEAPKDGRAAGARQHTGGGWRRGKERTTPFERWGWVT